MKQKKLYKAFASAAACALALAIAVSGVYASSPEISPNAEAVAAPLSTPAPESAALPESAVAESAPAAGRLFGQPEETAERAAEQAQEAARPGLIQQTLPVPPLLPGGGLQQIVPVRVEIVAVVAADDGTPIGGGQIFSFAIAREGINMPAGGSSTGSSFNVSVPIVGNVTGSSIVYLMPGWYTIREINPKDIGTYKWAGVTYDAPIDGYGRFKVAAGTSMSLTARNTYTSQATGTLSIILPPVTNTVLGDAFGNESFSYTLKADRSYYPMPERNSFALRNGESIDLGSIAYSQAGVYTYTLRQAKGSNPNISYDASVYTLTVEVKSVGGTLTASVSWAKDRQPLSSPKAIAFVNTAGSFKPEKDASLTVTKEVAAFAAGDGARTKFSFTLTTVDKYREVSELSFELRDGESKTFAFASGTRFYLEEEGAERYNAAYSEQNGTLTGRKHVTVTNTKKQAHSEGFDLKIAKKVSSYAEGDSQRTKFLFTLTFLQADGKTAKTSFSLKDGQSKTVSGIPKGTAYFLEEDAPEYGTIYSGGQKGKISSNQEVVVINKAAQLEAAETGSVSVTKQVKSFAKGDDSETEFSFTATFDFGTEGEWNVEFTLKDGETQVFTDLADGTAYRILENDSEGAYTATYYASKGKISAGESLEATVVNHAKVKDKGEASPQTGDFSKTNFFAIAVSSFAVLVAAVLRKRAKESGTGK
jgi:pilin isopeptide linkage protein